MPPSVYFLSTLLRSFTRYSYDPNNESASNETRTSVVLPLESHLKNFLYFLYWKSPGAFFKCDNNFGPLQQVLIVLLLSALCRMSLFPCLAF